MVEPLPREDDRETYLWGVNAVKEQIVQGNLLQGVLSRRMQVRTDMPAIEAYRALRTGNPSPYMFYLDFGEFQLFGASPEVHVKVRDGAAAIRPLAGTRRRGADAAEDARLEQELLSDPKERAEHLMLVDLARNDLGRGVRPRDRHGDPAHGRRAVFPRHAHRVARRRNPGAGAHGAGRTAGDIPARGPCRAPRRSGRSRSSTRWSRCGAGVLRGAVAHVESDGSLDSCISIRCALKQGDIVTLQAGAGVVYDSVPEKEFQETEAKLGALARALGMETRK